MSENGLTENSAARRASDESTPATGSSPPRYSSGGPSPAQSTVNGPSVRRSKSTRARFLDRAKQGTGCNGGTTTMRDRSAAANALVAAIQTGDLATLRQVLADRPDLVSGPL